MRWSLDLLHSEEIMSDKIRFITQFKVKTKSDIAFIEIIKNEIDKSNVLIVLIILVFMLKIPHSKFAANVHT